MKANKTISVLITLSAMILLVVAITPLLTKNSELVLSADTNNVAQGFLLPWQSRDFNVNVVDKKSPFKTFIVGPIATGSSRRDTTKSNFTSVLVLRNTLLGEKESELRLATFKEVCSLFDQYSMEIRSLSPPGARVGEQEVTFIVALSQSQTNNAPIHSYWSISASKIVGSYSFSDSKEVYHKEVYGGKFVLPTLYVYAKR